MGQQQQQQPLLPSHHAPTSTAVTTTSTPKTTALSHSTSAVSNNNTNSTNGRTGSTLPTVLVNHGFLGSHQQQQVPVAPLSQPSSFNVIGNAVKNVPKFGSVSTNSSFSARPAAVASASVATHGNRNVRLSAAAASTSSVIKVPADKKQQKRAANRRSAQLSRKRKKQFIEELREENDDLRRKEQILKAIPDLVVVFDSSGKLGFVSESVGRFLDASPNELEGTSFWDMICEGSVRLLKAAFMDSLAARHPDSDTALLGSGVWELRLKDKHSEYKLVTLNGVVHFKGEAPEVVCCMRPLRDQQQQLPLPPQLQSKSQASVVEQQTFAGDGNGIDIANGNSSKNKTTNRSISCSDGDASRISDESNGTQQRVVGRRNGASLLGQDEAATEAKKWNKKYRRMMHHEGAQDDNNSSNNNEVKADGNSIRISDGDSSDG